MTQKVEDEATVGERLYDPDALNMCGLTFRRVVNLSRPEFKSKDGKTFTCYENALIARAIADDGTAMEMPITRQMLVDLYYGVMESACWDA